MAASIILITAGVVFCLFGYALYRLWAAFTGLVIGLAAGVWLERTLGAAIWPVIVGLALGIALAGTFYYFQIAGAILSGAGAGFILAMLILYTIGSSNWPLALLVMAAAITVGLNRLPTSFCTIKTGRMPPCSEPTTGLRSA